MWITKTNYICKTLFGYEHYINLFKISILFIHRMKHMSKIKMYDFTQQNAESLTIPHYISPLKETLYQLWNRDAAICIIERCPSSLSTAPRMSQLLNLWRVHQQIGFPFLSASIPFNVLLFVTYRCTWQWNSVEMYYSRGCQTHEEVIYWISILWLHSIAGK